MRSKGFGAAIGLLAIAAVGACSNSTGFNGDARSARTSVRPDLGSSSIDDPVGLPEDTADAVSSGVRIENPAIAVQPPNAGAPVSVERTFPTRITRDSSVEIKGSLNLLSTPFTLARHYDAYEVSRVQAERPSWRDELTQGSDGTAVTEAFQQGKHGVIDLVVVIDNSSSMKEEQKELASKLKPLLSYLTDTDWRIGVITTDAYHDDCPEVIYKTDSNAEARYAELINAGTNGSGDELGILQAYKAIFTYSYCPSWIRKDSNIAVLIVSDEDNCSDGKDSVCNGEPYRNSEYLTNALAKVRTLGTTAKVYGIYWHPDTPKTECGTGENTASIYNTAVKLTNGRAGSICDKDYAGTLAAISKDVYESLVISYVLKAPPRSDSMKVMVGSEDWTSRVRLTEKTVTFSQTPPFNSVITIYYKHGLNTIVRDIAVSRRPDLATLVVRENGQPLDRGDYAYDAVAQRIVFAKAPPELAKMAVSYREDGLLKKEFAVAPGLRVNPPPTIAVNGGVANNARYDGLTGNISFIVAPVDGAVISVTGATPKDPILAYPFAVPSPDLLTAAWQDATLPLPVVTVKDGSLSVRASEFREGATLVVSYRDPAAAPQRLTLPQIPIAGSLAVSVTGAVCSTDSFRILNGNELTSECVLPADAVVRAAFSYLAAAPTKFSIPELTGADRARWEVWVNEEPRSDFSQEGNSVQFTGALPPGTVKVRVTGKQ